MQRSPVPPRDDLALGLAGGRAREIAGHGDEGVQLRLDRVDPPKARLRELDGRDLSRADEPGGFLERELRGVLA